MKKIISYIVLTGLLIQPIMAQSQKKEAETIKARAEQFVRQGWQQLKSYVWRKYRGVVSGEDCSPTERTLLVGAIALPVVMGLKQYCERDARLLEQHLIWFEYAKGGNADNIQQMIRAGIDVNTQDKKGATALMYAAKKGYQRVFEILMSNDADKMMVDRQGRIAAHYAAYYNHLDLIKLVLECSGGFPSSIDAGLRQSIVTAAGEGRGYGEAHGACDLLLQTHRTRALQPCYVNVPFCDIEGYRPD